MDFEAHDRAIIADLEADLAAARAEIERLNKELIEQRKAKNHAVFHKYKQTERAEKAEVECDELRALMSATHYISAEAYGREKVREGMRRAADLFQDANHGEHIMSAILAAMEKLK